MIDLRTRIRTAVSTVLDRAETGQMIDAVVDAVMATIDTPHVVEFARYAWHTEHPIACRDAGLRHCEIHARVQAMVAHDGIPPDYGRYEARILDDGVGHRFLDLQFIGGPE